MSSEIKVSSVKAKDGTAGLSIADSTGRVTLTETNPSLTLGTNTTFPAGHIVQVVTDSKSHSGIGVSVSGDGNTLTNSSGYQLFNTAFTPKYSTSKIIIQTSNVISFENSNVGDWGWLGAWYDSTNVAMVYGTANNSCFNSNLGVSTLSLNHTFNSWGDTEKNINVRVGKDGAGVVLHMTNNYTPSTPSAQTVGLTIMEVKQ